MIKLNGDAWLSLVERCVRDAEVVGSNPASPTTVPFAYGGCSSAVRAPDCDSGSRGFESH